MNSRVFLPFNEARECARGLGVTTKRAYQGLGSSRLPDGLPTSPDKTYSGQFVNWNDFLGTEAGKRKNTEFLPFQEARKLARKLSVTTKREYQAIGSSQLPSGLPASPEKVYQGKFISWPDYLGSNYRDFLSYAEARTIVRGFKLVSGEEYLRLGRDILPFQLPTEPMRYYGEEFISWDDFLGVGLDTTEEYLPFEVSRAIVSAIGFESRDDFHNEAVRGYGVPSCLPLIPELIYKDSFKGWYNYLGYDEADYKANLRALHGDDLKNLLRSRSGLSLVSKFNRFDSALGNKFKFECNAGHVFTTKMRRAVSPLFFCPHCVAENKKHNPDTHKQLVASKNTTVNRRKDFIRAELRHYVKINNIYTLSQFEENIDKLPPFIPVKDMDDLRLFARNWYKSNKITSVCGYLGINASKIPFEVASDRAKRITSGRNIKSIQQWDALSKDVRDGIGIGQSLTKIYPVLKDKSDIYDFLGIERSKNYELNVQSPLIPSFRRPYNQTRDMLRSFVKKYEIYTLSQFYDLQHLLPFSLLDIEYLSERNQWSSWCSFIGIKSTDIPFKVAKEGTQEIVRRFGIKSFHEWDDLTADQREGIGSKRTITRIYSACDGWEGADRFFGFDRLSIDLKRNDLKVLTIIRENVRRYMMDSGLYTLSQFLDCSHEWPASIPFDDLDDLKNYMKKADSLKSNSLGSLSNFLGIKASDIPFNVAKIRARTIVTEKNIQSLHQWDLLSIDERDGISNSGYLGTLYPELRNSDDLKAFLGIQPRSFLKIRNRLRAYGKENNLVTLQDYIEHEHRLPFSFSDIDHVKTDKRWLSWCSYLGVSIKDVPFDRAIEVARNVAASMEIKTIGEWDRLDIDQRCGIGRSASIYNLYNVYSEYRGVAAFLGINKNRSSTEYSFNDTQRICREFIKNNDIKSLKEYLDKQESMPFSLDEIAHLKTNKRWKSWCSFLGITSNNIPFDIADKTAKDIVKRLEIKTTKEWDALCVDSRMGIAKSARVSDLYRKEKGYKGIHDFLGGLVAV